MWWAHQIRLDKIRPLDRRKSPYNKLRGRPFTISGPHAPKPLGGWGQRMFICPMEQNSANAINTLNLSDDKDYWTQLCRSFRPPSTIWKISTIQEEWKVLCARERWGWSCRGRIYSVSTFGMMHRKENMENGMKSKIGKHHLFYCLL